MAKFQVIQGSPIPDAPVERVRKRIRASSPPALLSCHRCGGHEVIETRIGMIFKNGKASGGTKTILCATCHRKGERVVLA